MEVEVFTGSGSEPCVRFRPAPDGSYTITGLATGTYDVCFSGKFAWGGASTTGYASECYKNVAWDGDPYEASGATGVQVTAGSTTSDINVSAGQRRSCFGHGCSIRAPIRLIDVPVEVLTSNGTSVGYGGHRT